MSTGLIPWLGRFGFAMLGYLGAVLAAVAATVAVLFLLSLYPENGEAPPVLRYIKQIPQTFLIGFVITSQAAVPGFLSALTLAAIQRWRAWQPYLVMGGLNAVVSLAVFNLFVGTPAFNMPMSLLGPCIVGGLAGGITFWCIAGQRVGSWRPSAP